MLMGRELILNELYQNSPSQRLVRLLSQRLICLWHEAETALLSRRLTSFAVTACPPEEEALPACSERSDERRLHRNKK
jgi:hypothetical protein